ncbi:Microtubule-associated serine/threonine-protein kinase 2 [Tritrichomonas musculus]|uniref:non-specific serine/threonine protein kinase n=1 Tax=Tritrichomonas musculus TaxID=1915356 RepID=A0ABR2KSE6_9EUKA
MEYLPGGDLYSLLQNLGSLDESAAKLYVLQIVHALKYLRENGIIHRDLKPDNILISNTGHLKLTDFGLSFIGMFNRQLPVDDQKIESNSYVGTPDYVAPEIILARPHTFTCDLWSLGVIMYEMLCGVPPFHEATESETRQKIVSGFWNQKEVAEEYDLSDEAIDLISKLLKVNPEERIGAKSIDEIIKHAWFEDVDENAEAPFIPELNSDEDTDYFLCREKTTELNDKDIIDDMNLDIQNNNNIKNEPNLNNRLKGNNRKIRNRSKSNLEVFPQFHENDTQNNSLNNNSNSLEIAALPGFQSISVRTLAADNIRLSENYKRRRMSSGLMNYIIEKNDFEQLTGSKLDKNKKPSSFSNNKMGDLLLIENIVKDNQLHKQKGIFNSDHK